MAVGETFLVDAATETVARFEKGDTGAVAKEDIGAAEAGEACAYNADVEWFAGRGGEGFELWGPVNIKR